MQHQAGLTAKDSSVYGYVCNVLCATTRRRSGWYSLQTQLQGREHSLANQSKAVSSSVKFTILATKDATASGGTFMEYQSTLLIGNCKLASSQQNSTLFSANGLLYHLITKLMHTAGM